MYLIKKCSCLVIFLGMMLGLSACASHHKADVISRTGKPVLKSKPTKNKISHLKWQWPVQGKVVRRFIANDHSKGIDIAGQLGTQIKSASDGVVLYSGNGLKGYGNLLIIKHTEALSSVYAHNESLKVKEGEKVRAGQIIALMGKTESTHVKLHFEIRHQGKSVDPLKFLPKT